MRRICQHCKAPVKVSAAQLKSLGISEEQAAKASFHRGRGCAKCNGLGCRGRVAIFEILTLSGRIRDMIFENASVEALRQQAIKEGMRTLRLSALSKAFQGIITLEEASLFAGRK